MVVLMLKECLILQARLLSLNNHRDDGLSDDHRDDGLSDDRRNCAWIVASNPTLRLTKRNITAGDVELILDRVKETLHLDTTQNKMLAHIDISKRRSISSTVRAAIESAAKKCPPSRTNLNYSPWEMFIFVRRKTTWEYIRISHVCFKDDEGNVTIQSTVFHEENSSDTAHFSFQEVKEALVDILDKYPRQYLDAATGSTTSCPSGGLFRQIAYLASEQLFEGRDVGKVVPDEFLQNYESYVKTYIENSRTETTSTLIECGNCRTWNVSPGGFIFQKSDQYYCRFLGRTCFGGSSHGNTLCLPKKRRISKRESQDPATERFVADLRSFSEAAVSSRSGNDLPSDPPDTNFETKDISGQHCIENSMVDRQSSNYVIPPGIIGSRLTCIQPKAAYINECPWCGQVFSVNGEYDLLSDLHNFSFKTKDTKQFVSHEKEGSCVFWGLRIHRAIKSVPRITDQPLIRLRIFRSVVSVLGYGPTRNSTHKNYICYEDTETKDSFLRKIFQIFRKAEDFLDETRHNPIEWTGKVADLIFFSFEFRERTCLKPKPELWRRLTKYYLGQLHQAIVCGVRSWPFDFDGSTRVRIVCDANLSLFNYYYFWYASLFYKATVADQLLPIRDIGMEQLYSVRQVPVPVMKGLHELQDKVLEVMVARKCIVVWEGKNYDIRSWHQHITFVLKQLQLIKFHSDLLYVSQSDPKRNSTLRVEGEQEWQIRREAAMEQSDWYNCGPLACMKLWETFYPDDKEPKTVSSGNCRDSILRKYEELYAKMKNDFKVGAKELTGENGAEYDVSQFVDMSKDAPHTSSPR